MKTARLGGITLVFLWVSPSAYAWQDQATAVIDSFIERQARQQRGEEYRDARKVSEGDLNHDGVPDAAVLYTIEGQGGSNYYAQYLAVFVSGKGVLIPVAHIAVGRKGYRSVELASVSDNAVHLETLDYVPKDADCCPSKRGATDYRLVDGVLREQKRPRAQGRRH
jgi:hypothetical protein